MHSKLKMRVFTTEFIVKVASSLFNLRAVRLLVIAINRKNIMEYSKRVTAEDG